MTENPSGSLAQSLFERMRRQRATQDVGTTGLDHVEAAFTPPASFVLTLFFLPKESTGQPSLPARLAPANLRISREDGTPFPGVWVQSVHKGKAQGEEVYMACVETDPALAERLSHDLSRYVLEIVGVAEVDRFLARSVFSWSGVAEAPSEQLPAITLDLPPLAEIDYLAKDFESFRKLMLDRMALVLPEWAERNPVDLGVAIIEVLAYAADYLSYYQDAVATEAYLETARERVSVRRHVRLLDYRLHEGCNARVWLQIRPGTENAVAPQGTEVLTGSSEEGTVARSSDPTSSYQRRIASGAQVFETMYEARLRSRISSLKLYAWGLPEFFLPVGATSAALEGEPPLEKGDVLVFRQAKNPVSGQEEDADLRRAHAVRLSEAPRRTSDGGRKITEIVWFEEDALPFPLWVVRETRQEVLTGLAEVRGNVVLADHGQTICEELPPVPASGEYRPMLREKNLVSSVPFDGRKASPLPARAALVQNPHEALPAIVLYEVNERYFYQHAKPISLPSSDVVLLEEPKAVGLQAMEDSPGPELQAMYPSPVEEGAVATPGLRSHFDRVFAETLELEPGGMPHLEIWRPKQDLLESGRFARDFVVETEDDGLSRLRFGDGLQGLEPSPGSRFWAVYRIGSPPRGNVGPRTVTQLVTDGDLTAGLASARNDVAAQGGLLPENIEEARRNAPQAFHVQQRCVTEGDYVALAERFPGVFKAQCVKSWNGSGTTATVAVQRQGGRAADDAFLKRVDLYLCPFLLLGHQLEVRAPFLVPLLVALAVEIEPGHLKSTVREDLLQVLGDRRLADGRVGFFYPDNFTFGQPVYLSELIAAAMAVHGVASIEVLEFQRLGRERGNELETGRIDMDRLEIAQCRNDPAAPHLGRIELQFTGGR